MQAADHGVILCAFLCPGRVRGRSRGEQGDLRGASHCSTSLGRNCCGCKDAGSNATLARSSSKYCLTQAHMSLNTPDLSKMHRPARLIVHCTTVVLLLASISLSLLVLLTPTYGHDLSMFTLRPIGRERAPIALSPSNSTTATDQLSPTASSASWSSSISGRQESDAKASQRDNETPGLLEALTTRGPADEPEGSADGSFGRTMYAWLGLNGPSIYVGVMREQMRDIETVDC